jgi:hypothetical protein
MSPEPQEKSETSSQPGPEALQAMKAPGRTNVLRFFGFLGGLPKRYRETKSHIHFQDMTDDIYDII